MKSADQTPPRGLIEFLREEAYVLEDSIDKNAFGNQIYQFETDNMIIRVIKDRSIWSIEILCKSAKNSEFYDLSYIISHFEGDESKDAMSINEKGNYFVANFNKISVLFNHKNYKSTIEILKNERLKFLKTQPWYNAWFSSKRCPSGN